jgi:hypothetical protein
VKLVCIVKSPLTLLHVSGGKPFVSPRSTTRPPHYSTSSHTICPRCFSIGRWPSLGSPADPRLATYLPTHRKTPCRRRPPRLTGTAWRQTYHDLGVSLIAARVAADRPLSKVSSWKTQSLFGRGIYAGPEVDIYSSGNKK